MINAYGFQIFRLTLTNRARMIQSLAGLAELCEDGTIGTPTSLTILTR